MGDAAVNEGSGTPLPFTPLGVPLEPLGLLVPVGLPAPLPLPPGMPLPVGLPALLPLPPGMPLPLRLLEWFLWL